MGSSVIHGGTSTFLAISMLGFAESYVFMTFFKTWVGIIIFGISNGFLLMPVILATCGPLVEPNSLENDENSGGATNAFDVETGEKAAQKRKSAPGNGNRIEAEPIPVT